MVTVDINIKGVISLFEDEAIKKDRAKELLSEFSKDELIAHIIDDIAEEEENESVFWRHKNRKYFKK